MSLAFAISHWSQSIPNNRFFLEYQQKIKIIISESEIGGIIQFRFSKGSPDFNFEVIDLQSLKTVEWKCLHGPKERINTHFGFNSSIENEETVLLFKHSGCREEVEFMHHCSTQWAYYLIGLRKFLESGEGTPNGRNNYELVSRWSK